MPYDQLLPRVQRLAVREFSRDPNLPFATFEQRMKDTFFPDDATLQGVEDLLALQRIWTFESDWYWSSPLLDPAFFRQRAKHLNWPAEKLAVYQRHFERLVEIANYHGSSPVQAEREMARCAQEIITSWGKDRPISPLSAPGR